MAVPRAAGMLASMKSITRTQLFRGAVAVIALHIADDNFVQPEAGTSAGDHLVSGLRSARPASALAAWGFPRLSGGRQGALALFIAPLGIATGHRGDPLRQPGGRRRVTTSPAS